LTGPFEVLSRVPGVHVDLVARDGAAVVSDTGLRLTPTTTFAACPRLDVICVPGGPGVNAAILDSDLVDFVRRQATGARFVTSVCAGALVLGAAGLLVGRRAATHWAAVDFLDSFGAVASNERVCTDGDLVTGGGVTAGIDFGLSLAARLAGDEIAQRIQLTLEYAPQPPFDSGTPATASARVVEEYRTRNAAVLQERATAVRAAAAAMTKDRGSG
jgi:cyclohexyl-isocyanide hydratase